MPEHPYQLSGIYINIFRWRKFLLVLMLAAGLLSTLVAWLLPNEYKSTTVFYPTDLNAINPDEVVGGDRRSNVLFGNTEDIDRILTIAYSQPLAEYIIRKHHLWQHYNLDTTSEANRQYVLDEFLDNFIAEHTERDAIAVTFYDRDKIMAANIANDIAARIDVLNQQLTYENRKKVLDIFNRRYQYLQRQYHQMHDSLLQSRRRFRIFGSALDTRESRPESRYLAEQLIQTETELRQLKAEAEYLQKSGGAAAKLSALKARIHGLQQAFTALSTTQNGNLLNYETYTAGADAVSGLEAQFAGLQEEYILAKKAYTNARLALEGNISTIYIVQKALPAIKKARPVRWLIVMGATLFAGLLAVCVIMVLEAGKPQNSPN